MKKRYVKSAIVLFLIFCCVGCNGNAQEATYMDDVKITEFTIGTTEQIYESSGNIEYFQKLLSYDGGYWYWRILGCTFNEPQEISLKYMFYNGMKYEERQDPDTYTDREVMFLKDFAQSTWGDEACWVNAHKLPRQCVINVLEQYLGLDSVRLTIPEDWVFLEETDAYYYIRSDGYGVSGVTVIEVTDLQDGLVEIRWTAPVLRNTLTGEYMENPEMLLIMQKCNNGGYLVLSNVPYQ